MLAVARGKADLDELAAANELVTPCPADIGSNDAIEAIGSALTGLGGSVRMAVFAAGLPVRGSADTIDPDALAARQQHQGRRAAAAAARGPRPSGTRDRGS